jgi:hypothetical protein
MGLAQNLSSEASEKEIATPTTRSDKTQIPQTNSSALATPSVATQTVESSITLGSPTSHAEITKTPSSTTQSAVVITPTAQTDYVVREGYKSSFYSIAYIRSAVDFIIQQHNEEPEFKDAILRSYPALLNLLNAGLIDRLNTAQSTVVEYVGRIIDIDNQQPVVGAKITLDLAGGVPLIAYSDSEGIYRFIVSINSSVSGQIRIDAQGYQVYIRDINISPDINVIEDIRLGTQVQTLTRTPSPASSLVPSPTVLAIETPQKIIAYITVNKSFRTYGAGTSLLIFQDGSQKYCYEAKCEYKWTINGQEYDSLSSDIIITAPLPSTFWVYLTACSHEICGTTKQLINQ